MVEGMQWLLAQVNELASPKHAGEEIRQSAVAKAQRIAQEELNNLGLGPGRPARAPQGRSTKSLHRDAAAPRDDHDAGMDRGALVHGRGHACGLAPPASKPKSSKQ